MPSTETLAMERRGSDSLLDNREPVALTPGWNRVASCRNMVSDLMLLLPVPKL